MGSRELIDQLAESFVDRYRRGQRPSLSEYTRQHPELAERIERLFPTLVMMEELAAAGDDSAELESPSEAEKPLLEWLGDYRILREVGRGGMGIVFEAEQQSLERRVALKVLPLHRLLDENRLKRFHREARAAAQLHHTNIVPVFDVGEHDGIHYYAMQFIHGQGLDEVMAELMAMRRQDAAAASLLPGKPSPQPHELVVTAAEDHSDTSSFAPTTLLGESDFSNSSSQRYFRSVARLGAQVADALACAHQQGVLHRDVKPSNLMLDTEGHVWVTDFGLAKTDANEELTHTGDLVGTLRYMAPERFEGWSDARSDIYGLGLTLYEMLTLRSAYQEADRAQLIRRISNEPLPRPRRLNRHVPADLETIVLKATAKESRERYASAGDLADDLRRFLSNKPIVARRTSSGERAWMWCRRNPLVASLVTTIALLLTTAAVGASLAAVWLNRERNRAVAHLDWAVDAERVATQAAEMASESAERERQARLESQRSLYAARLAQARGGRTGERAGRRYDSLQAVREAAGLLPGLGLDGNAHQDALLQLRNEAIAAMAVVDLRLEKQWPGHGPPSAYIRVAFDQQLNRYARLESDGHIVVRQLSDNQELARFDGLGDLENGRPYLLFSNDGKMLAAKGTDRDAKSLRVVVWHLETGEALMNHPCGGSWEDSSIDFSPDSAQLAVSATDDTISVYDLADHSKEPQVVTRVVAPYAIRFSPDGTRLAISANTRVEIVPVEQGSREQTLLHADTARGVAWSPDAQRLAVACGDNAIHIWDTSSGRPMLQLRGHFSSVEHVCWSPDGRLLASSSWDRTSRLWEAYSGKELVRTENHALRFSTDGRWLGLGLAGSRIGRWEVAFPAEYRTLRRRATGVGRVQVAPNGRVAAMGTDTGVELWDLLVEAPVARLPAGRVTSVRFTSAGDYVIHAGEAGIYRWPIEAFTPDSNQVSAGNDSEQPPDLKVGPPEVIWKGDPWYDADVDLSLSNDDRILFTSRPQAVLIDTRDFSRTTLARSGVWDVAMSPDGRWAAAGSTALANTGIRVWDTGTGKLVHSIGAERAVRVQFSPNGRWLISSDWREFVLWDTSSWQALWRIAKDVPSNGATVALTPDSRLMAMTPSPTVLRLVELPSGKELASIEPPDAYPLAWLRFTPDGGRLFAVRTYGLTHVWDLELIRSQLAEMNLDWSPSAESGSSAARHRTTLEFRPLSIKVQRSFVIPGDAGWWISSGIARHNRRDFEGAIADYSKAIQVDNGLSAAWYRRAQSSASLGDYEDAVKDYERATQLDPDSYFAWIHLAWMHVLASADWQDLEKAQWSAEQAGKIRPGGYQWREVLGLIHCRRGKYEEAIETLTSIANAQRYAVVQHALAISYLQLGQAETARRHSEQADKAWKKAGNLSPFWNSVRHTLGAEARQLGW